MVASNNSRARSCGGLLALGGLGFLLAAVSCVNDDPIVTGKRDASADASPSAIAIVPGQDIRLHDEPDCRHCEETLSTESARDILCRDNGPPSSAELLSAVVDCVCYDKCIDSCTSYCAGSVQEPGCLGCVTENCLPELQACQADR